MVRTYLVRLVLVGACAAGAAGVGAQQALEIIALRYRTAEQVLPALQPLVEPGGTLSGSRGQLFLRASPANVAEIKRALEAIDRPAKRLQISVRFDDALQREERDATARVVIGSGGSRASASVAEARGSGSERVDQRVQVLEGGRAFIALGQSRPLGMDVQHLASGFDVVPRLAGDRVVLDVLAQRETPGAHPGTVQGQRIVSTVSARLGEWVEIGGTASQAARDDRAIGSASRSRAAESRRVWVKVEESAN